MSTGQLSKIRNRNAIQTKYSREESAHLDMSSIQSSAQSTAQAIEQAESLEVAQTLLHGSVGTVTPAGTWLTYSVILDELFDILEVRSQNAFTRHQIIQIKQESFSRAML